MLTVQVSNSIIKRKPGFYPTIDSVFAMTVAAFDKLKLDHFRYRSDRSDDISELTFIFNNRVRSPPKGTYFGEPDKVVWLPDEHISRLEFRTYKKKLVSSSTKRITGFFYYPYSLSVNEGKSVHIMPSKQTTY